MATQGNSGGGIDIADLLNGLAQSSQSNADAYAKLMANVNDSVAINVNSAGVARQEAADAALVTSTEKAAAMREQAAKLKVGATFGTDVTALNEVYTTLSGQMTESYAQQRAFAEKVKQKQSVSFFDNPLEFIVNSLTVNEDINAHNLAEAQGDAAFQQIQRLNAASSGAAQLQSQFKATVTQASAEAATRNAAALATQQANQYTLAGIAANSSGVETALKMNAQQLDNMFRAKSAINAEEQLQMSRQANQLARAREQREARLFEFNFKNKQDEDKYKSSVLESINFGRVARGVKPLEGVRAEAAFQMLKSNSDVGGEFKEDYRTGERARDTGKVVLADSPFDLAARMAGKQVINLEGPQEYVTPLLSRAMEFARTDKTWDPTNKDVAGNKAKFNKAVETLVAADAREVKVGDTKNLFALPGIQAYAGMNSIQQLPVYAKVFRERVKVGETFDDPNKVLRVLADEVSAGKVSYNEAVEISQVYQRGQAINLESKNLPKFGLPNLTPADIGYKVSIDLDQLKFGGTKIVDLTSKTDVGRALNSYLASIAYTQGVQGRRSAISGALDSVPLQFGPAITNVPAPDATSIYRR